MKRGERTARAMKGKRAGDDAGGTDVYRVSARSVAGVSTALLCSLTRISSD